MGQSFELTGRSAEDADGVGCGEGMSPPHSGRGLGQEFILILDLKMSTSNAFSALFLQFSHLLYTQEILLLDLENLLLHANRQQKAAKQACGKL